MTSTLILMRHGESEWNAKNLFTGWVDVELNEKGMAEAQRGGELLVESGLLPDVVHTSLLRRAIRTAQIALDVADRMWIETGGRGGSTSATTAPCRARTRRRPWPSSARSSS